jgi:hypothetical protein
MAYYVVYAPDDTITGPANAVAGPAITSGGERSRRLPGLMRWRKRSEHGVSRACARRFESEPVERDKPRAIKPRPEVSPRKDERDGNAPNPTPREHGYLTVAENLLRDALHPVD